MASMLLSAAFLTISSQVLPTMYGMQQSGNHDEARLKMEHAPAGGMMNVFETGVAHPEPITQPERRSNVEEFSRLCWAWPSISRGSGTLPVDAARTATAEIPAAALGESSCDLLHVWGGDTVGVRDED
jgi:hypothetical protein